MSVIAGCSLLDGILLGADCRVTIQQGSKETHRDTVQKLIAIQPDTAIGFVGSVRAASNLLQKMGNQGYRKERVDPISLLNWWPRLFRHHYANLKTSETVSFMVGSVIRGRPNVVERGAVVKLINHIAFGNPQVKRNWMPAALFEILKAHTTYVAIADAPTGLLYTMDSPNFVPRFYRPLDYVAIGSGQGVIEHIRGVHDMIVAWTPGQCHTEAHWLTTSMQDFISKNNIPTVGGMFTLLKLTAEGAVHLEWNTGHLPAGPFFQMAFENGRWVQRNLTTGKEIRLALPWELDPNDLKEHVFDDLRFRGF